MNKTEKSGNARSELFWKFVLILCFLLNFTFDAKAEKMVLIKECRGKSPVIGVDCYLAENATLIGELVMGAQCSVWFNAVIRADVNRITLGDRVNVQDGAVIHCTYQKAATIVGNDVSIGHNAIVHGCTIHDKVLIGMGAIVMDGAIVESGSIVAAGAVVLAGTRVESGSIYAGVPAKKVKDVSNDQLSGEIERIAGNYITYSSWFTDQR